MNKMGHQIAQTSRNWAHEDGRIYLIAPMTLQLPPARSHTSPTSPHRCGIRRIHVEQGARDGEWVGAAAEQSRAPFVPVGEVAVAGVAGPLGRALREAFQ